jgi:hypothetical protein
MKLIFSAITATALFFAATGLATADEPGNGAAVAVSGRYIFAPEGFDDNDEAVVTVDGYLPSGCYRLLRPEVTTDRATKTVTITPMARFFDIPCVEALIPYNFEVQLGVLPFGDYRVVLGGTDIAVTEALKVTEATNAGPDDYLYAPVDGAIVHRDANTGIMTAELTGRFTNSCMEWEDVRVIDNGKSVNVLPVITMNTDDRECTVGEYPFRKVVELPAVTATQRKLLHVRSLNGRAINLLYYAH